MKRMVLEFLHRRMDINIMEISKKVGLKELVLSILKMEMNIEENLEKEEEME